MHKHNYVEYMIPCTVAADEMNFVNIDSAVLTVATVDIHLDEQLVAKIKKITY